MVVLSAVGSFTTLEDLGVGAYGTQALRVFQDWPHAEGSVLLPKGTPFGRSDISSLVVSLTMTGAVNII